MKKLLFSNQKGGVGKTTAALCTGAALSRQGFRVLLVDTDAQGSLTKAAGAEPEEGEPTVFEVLTGRASTADAIRKAPGGYDILPADIRQSGADITLAKVKGRDFLLRDALQAVGSEYDYCIIDTPPALGVVTLMALTAADGLIIPLQCDYMPLEAVAQLMQTVGIVRSKMNPQLSITGVLLTFWDRTNITGQIAEYAAEGFPGKVFDTHITRLSLLRELPATRRDLYEYRPRSKAKRCIEEFEKLAAEIVDRTK